MLFFFLRDVIIFLLRAYECEIPADVHIWESSTRLWNTEGDEGQMVSSVTPLLLHCSLTQWIIRVVLTSPITREMDRWVDK